MNVVEVPVTVAKGFEDDQAVPEEVVTDENAATVAIWRSSSSTELDDLVSVPHDEV